jgi:hypothetical protein
VHAIGMLQDPSGPPSVRAPEPGEYRVNDDSDSELLNRYRVFHEAFERLELCELETLTLSS